MLVAGLLLLAVAEVPHWRASHQAFPGPQCPGSSGHEVVLVLGCPSRRSGAPHPMQRWRTDIAVRSSSPGARMVFSGAGPDGGRSEAEVMAGYARRVHRVAADRITLETRARSTWENVAFSAGELQGARTIRIASSPLHAARARRYLARQRPDLASRLAPAADYRVGERIGCKLLTVLYAAGRLVLHARRVPGPAPVPAARLGTVAGCPHR